MILILLVVLAITVIYLKFRKHYSYWKDKGVKQRKQIYLLGDNAGFILKKESFVETILKTCDAFPEERYVGMYKMLQPALLVKDPELIKLITVKDFDHFVDHKFFVRDGIDPLWSRNLIALKGDKWHDMRSILSPSFTTSKMKTMFCLISKCASAFTEYFIEMRQETLTLDLYDAFSRYSTDVIATSAFGIQCNSVKKRENEFYMMGAEATSLTGFWRTFRFLSLAFVPNICKTLGITFINKDVSNFFQTIVSETIATREKNNITRPDMLQLLMEARKHKHKNNSESDNHTINKESKEAITDLDITAQGLIFFFGGFTTVSTAMCFMAHELAIRTEIQKKLQMEIDSTFKECKGKLTYEALMKMRYMDMVVSEVLRKWPTMANLDRMCVKPYTIQPDNENEKSLNVQTGDVIWIPVIGLHRNAKYFPNPEVFDPERFNDENKHKIQPYTYFPFGLGPRSCIASRFALMEIKALFFHLLLKFDFVPVQKTQIPIKLKPLVGIVAENGFWIGLQRR